MERKDKRRLYYQKLRKAGFTPKEATRFKCLKQEKIDALCELRRKQEDEIASIAKG